jgi:MtN3 and saliva related transmembrane protein
MNWIEVLGIVAACCTTVSFLPQAIKTIREKDTSGISASMYFIFTTGTILWLSYGVLTNNFPIMLANAITSVLAAIILLYKFRYK